MKQRLCLVLLLFIPLIMQGQGINTDSISFSANTRYTYYTLEETGELLIHIPARYSYNLLNITILQNRDTIGTWKGIPRSKLLRTEIKTGLVPAKYKISALISIAGLKTSFVANTELLKLAAGVNDVKCDRLTGGLISGNKQFFPFGFYSYSPVHRLMPEEEAVRGFNMISPYQKILPQTITDRKAFMDRCASLGMKVHYNLLSVSGGGGINSELQGITWKEKREWLINEIKAFRDHPALLGWYIADEPNGYNIEPDTLRKIYEVIREIDPRHPVSMVFMAPFISALRYINALDIVMIDPYPVPVLPVSYATNIAGQVVNDFNGRRPVWMVPQAFGGGEQWQREPTIQELRALTIQSIIKGVSGIQYFIRQGPNIFPKSVAAWSECGRMAVETALLTPWLLSDLKAPEVISSSQDVIVRSAIYENQLMIMVANRSITPRQCGFTIRATVIPKGKVLFENRTISASGGFFSDHLSSFGTQVYMFRLRPPEEKIKAWPGNLLLDPGFEDTSSPGVPAACYAWGNGDRGATYFTDTRQRIEGNQSVRLVTPSDNSGIRLRFFPVNVLYGQNYTLSFWARKDDNQPAIPPRDSYIDVSLGGFGTTRFILSEEWQQFVTNVTIPYTDDIPGKLNLTITMPSQGIGWIDMVQVVKSHEIFRSINPEINKTGIYE